MREKISINTGWKFYKGDISSSHLNDYNDIYWEDVNLPHCVELGCLNNSGGRNFQGVVRYRKEFVIDKKNEERILIDFQGAMQVLEVWINERKLPTHYCGYTPFVYDITDYVKYDEVNCIAVRLDNSDNADVPPGKPQTNLDFTYEGGIYKNVYLHRLPKCHVTNAVSEGVVAGGGLYVSYKDISDKQATVCVKSHIRNITDNIQNLVLKQILLSNGAVSATASKKIEITPNSAEHFNMEVLVESPKLWSPNNPNTYMLLTQLELNGEILDGVQTRIGIRDFTFTRENGFTINGEKIKLLGGNYHTTYAHVGNAMSDNLLRRDARKLREAGMLCVRSHYPFPEAFLDECDKLGITAIISNPGWQFFKEGIFVTRAGENLRTIIRNIRNHPCIVIWECILNETHQMTDEFEWSMHNIAHEELPLGPCYTASDSANSDIAYKWEDTRMHGLAFIKSNPGRLDVIKEKTKNMPLFVREFGDCPDNFTDQNSPWRVKRAWGEDLMVRQVRHMLWEKQAKWTINYRCCYNNDALSGACMWPAIEHTRGYHMNNCYGGFLDTQRFEKYSFYFFKSQQDADVKIENIDCGPMAFIANSWSELSPDTITVYSNCEKIRLYCNDEFIEERTPDDYPVKHPPFTFNRDFYTERPRSEIRVEGIINGEVVATDKRFSPGVAVGLKLEADTMGIDMCADGSDLLFIRLIAIDDRGNHVPLTFDGHEVEFTVTGEAKIVGENVKTTELGKTGIIIQASENPGKITITAKQKFPQRNARVAYMIDGMGTYIEDKSKKAVSFYNAKLEINSK